MFKRFILFTVCALLAPLALGAYSVTFSHAAGKAAVAPGRETAYALSVLDSLATKAGSSITGVEVRTYGSPEGALSWNTRLAGLRSAKVLGIVREKCPGLPDSLITVKTVPEDWDSAVAYLKSSGKPWKDEALQIIRTGGDMRKAKLQDLWAGEAWDDLLWNCFSRLRRTVVDISFAPDFQFSRTSAPAVSGEYSVSFPVGRTSVQGWYGENARTLDELREIANTAGQGKKVAIDSYSSPEGRASWNIVLARRRAEAVRAFLVSAGFPADAVSIRSCEEDWAGLREGVALSYFGPDKSELLSILDDSSIGSDERKTRLSKVSGGAAWNRLIAGWMQDLRLVKVSLIE